MKIEIATKAAKQLEKLPPVERKKVDRKIRLLAQTARSGKQLMGAFQGLHAIRAWPYRILYEITDEETLVIVSIAHRQSVYKS